jgi:chemotaxis response regulator CheB
MAREIDAVPRQLKVLVVEDSAVSFAAIRLAMRLKPGWSAEMARDADAAMHLCATQPPDVLTLDLTLPGGGGLELLSAIKSTFDLPVVVVSASTYEGSPVTAEALVRGADACFDKTRILTDARKFIDALSAAARSARARLSRSAA